MENLAKIIIAFACKFQYNAFLFIAAQVFVKRVGLQCTESVAPCPLDIRRYFDDDLLRCGTLHIGELALSLGFHKVIFRLCLLWVVGCGCSLIELLETSSLLQSPTDFVEYCIRDFFLVDFPLLADFQRCVVCRTFFQVIMGRYRILFPYGETR